MSHSPGSIISSLQFISYKIDKIDYSIEQNLYTVSYDKNIKSNNIDMGIALRDAYFFEDSNSYASGLDFKFTLLDKTRKGKEACELLNGHIGIVGLFKVTDKKLDQETIETLIRIQAPTLLMPYLRVSITTILACSGFSGTGGIIMPLINVYALAEQNKEHFKIKHIPKNND